MSQQEARLSALTAPHNAPASIAQFIYKYTARCAHTVGNDINGCSRIVNWKWRETLGVCRSLGLLCQLVTSV